MRRRVAHGFLAAWVCVASAGAADVATLSQELGAPNLAVRRDAAYQLDRMGVAAKDALPALIRALDDNDKQVWSFAISALAKLGPEAKDAIPALIEGLGNRRTRGRDRDRRQAITRSAFALSRIGAAAIPPLIDALKSDDNGMRAGAAKALAGMRGGAAPAIPALIANLKSEDDVRGETAEALGAIGAAAAQPLMDSLKSTEPRERAGAAMSLAFIGAEAQESAPVILALAKSDSDPQVRIALLGALQKIGVEPGDAVPLLVAGITDDHEALRHAAINALVLLRGGRDRSLAALTPLLKDENTTTRQRAARALGRMGPGAAPAVPALIEAARTSPADGTIANALAEIGPEVLPAVLAALQNASAPDAERLLGLLRGFGNPAIPVLLEALKNSSPPVRAAAAKALGGMGRDAKRAAEPLFALASDPEAPVRAAALRALVPLGAGSEKLKPLLDAALRDPAPEVRRAAAAGLAGSGGANGLGAAVLVNLLDDENPATRRSALEGLGGMGAAASSALPAVIERLTDPDLQIPAITALGKIGPTASPAVPHLIELAKSGPVTTRVAALAALTGISRAASAALPVVHDALKDGDIEVRAAAIPALVAVESDESKTIATLVKAVSDEDGRVRRPAAAALAKFRERARAATPGLITMLERDTDRGVALLSLKVIGVRSVPDLLRALSMKEPPVRVFACDQLAALGPEAKEAIPRLKELASEQPQEVLEAARAALAKIEPAP